MYRFNPITGKFEFVENIANTQKKVLDSILIFLDETNLLDPKTSVLTDENTVIFEEVCK